MTERVLPGIIVAQFIPDEIAATVMPLVDSHLDLLPGWIVELDVLWEDDFESVAKMCPHIDYRRGKLTIGPSWLMTSDKMRRRTIMHEFVHVQLGPLHILAARLVDIAGKGNDALDTELRDQLRIALEQTTVDVTALVERLINYIEQGTGFVVGAAHGNARGGDADVARFGGIPPALGSATSPDAEHER